MTVKMLYSEVSFRNPLLKHIDNQNHKYKSEHEVNNNKLKITLAMKQWFFMYIHKVF